MNFGKTILAASAILLSTYLSAQDKGFVVSSLYFETRVGYEAVMPGMDFDANASGFRGSYLNMRLDGRSARVSPTATDSVSTNSPTAPSSMPRTGFISTGRPPTGLLWEEESRSWESAVMSMTGHLLTFTIALNSGTTLPATSLASPALSTSLRGTTCCCRSATPL